MRDDVVEAPLGLLGPDDVRAPRLAEPTGRRAPTGARAGRPRSTLPAHAEAPTPAAATTGSPTTMPTAAPAPNSTMPSGDIIARATGG